MQRANSVGIVGAGVAGLQLALHLQRHGVPTTLYTDRTPEQIRGARLPNTVCRFAPTRDRERALGVEHWDEPRFGTFGIDFRITGAPIAFQGAFSRPASFVDMRLYQATLLEDAAAAGTRVVYGALQPADVERHAREHALMVVASGRGRLAEPFPRVAEQSPYMQPQRRLFAGLFHGLHASDAADLAFCISPGHGEVFAFAPFLTFDGPVGALLVEAIPGGALEPLTRGGLADEPTDVKQRAFELTRPQDVHRGAIVPVVRRGYRVLQIAVAAWFNATLRPPRPHVLDLFRAATGNRAIADAIADDFAAPQRAWSVFGSPEGAARFLQEFEQAAA
jgi:Styrene monooxygenase A putative substrate binding domain